MPSQGEPISADGYWVWNGQRWLPAHSNATFRWSGTAWKPIASRGKTSPSTWDPPWRFRDSLGLLAWLVVVPIVIAAALLAVWKPLGLGVTAPVIAASGGYALWATIGGAIVRPNARFRDLAIIIAIVLLVVISVPSEWLAVADETKNGGQGQDLGAGLGIAFLFVVTFPPTLAFAAAGRFGRRLALRRHTPS
ncbi:MAG TPA: hypothetical protein VIK61_14855 [Acidimicrobiia bacterium]